MNPKPPPAEYVKPKYLVAHLKQLRRYEARTCGYEPCSRRYGPKVTPAGTLEPLGNYRQRQACSDACKAKLIAEKNRKHRDKTELRLPERADSRGETGHVPGKPTAAVDFLRSRLEPKRPKSAATAEPDKPAPKKAAAKPKAAPNSLDPKDPFPVAAPKPRDPFTHPNGTILLLEKERAGTGFVPTGEKFEPDDALLEALFGAFEVQDEAFLEVFREKRPGLVELYRQWQEKHPALRKGALTA